MVRESSYHENGQLAVVDIRDGNWDSDGAHDWSAIYQEYNQNGVIEHEYKLFDDGVVRESSYHENGQLAVVEIRDGNGDSDGAHDWSAIYQEYDEGGVLVSETTYFDDGSVKVESYDDGVLAAAVRTDDQDAHDWDQIVFAYDEVGAVTTQTRQMDDTDVIIFLYEEEEIATRLHVDNDDSHSWYLRVTDFAEGGDVFTTYDSYDDVPPEYQALIGVA